MSATTSMAIEALRAILGNQESMRQFAEFRYCFSDEKDTSIPVTLGGGTLQEQLQSTLPGTFMNIYLKGTGYHLLASGTFTDAEIHKAAGLAQITDYKTVDSKP